MSVRLAELTLAGFKTIKELRGFAPRPLSILIGANGAGKSNFISFFSMLNRIISSPGELQLHVATQGGAGRFLHDGQQTTGEMEASLALETEAGRHEYTLRLAYASGDTLVFTQEKYRFAPHGNPTPPWIDLGSGHRESMLEARAEAQGRTAHTMRKLLGQCVLYQFHDTSFTSRIRGKCFREDSRWLKKDAGNLAAFLRRLHDSSEVKDQLAYQRIVDTTRLAMPFLADFVLEPENGSVLLRWREKGCDTLFDASQASDGMLRAMALVALLGQPVEDLPPVLLLDEPELGLHPSAIELVADLLKIVSDHVQVIVATQSAALLDYFSPEDVVVVSRAGRESIFERKTSQELGLWLEEYTLGEIWRKNLIGAGPGE